MAEEPQNVVIRRENPGQGQGSTRAVSARTSWEYEHDETDAQIDKIEEIILSMRDEEGVVTGSSLHKRGATFSWSSDTDDGEGNIKLGTMYKQDGSDDWVCEWWIIAPDGKVTEEGVD
jgi:hypothetical protein